MPNIVVELDHKPYDGEDVKFVAPCDCSAVTGLKIKYPAGEAIEESVFTFSDSHCCDVTSVGNAFASGAYVKVMLDTNRMHAYIQNADTNTYVEEQMCKPIDFSRFAQNAKSLSFTNIIVPDSAWEEAGDEPNHPWRAAIMLPDSGVDGDYFVDIDFADSDAELSKRCLSFDGGFYIFAVTPPERLVVINTAECTPTAPIERRNEVFGSIIVTYEAGATVTCENGTTKLIAKTTSGSWQFGVPNAGVWVVSDGENEHSVSVTTQGQLVSIKLEAPKTWLFINGEVNTELTGGINGTIVDGVYKEQLTLAAGENKTYTTKNAINLSNYSVMKIEFENSATSSQYVYFRILLDDAAQNGTKVTTSGLVAYKSYDSPFESGRLIAELDLSGYDGNYYLGYAYGVESAASGNRAFTNKIYSWWLE